MMKRCQLTVLAVVLILAICPGTVIAAPAAQSDLPAPRLIKLYIVPFGEFASPNLDDLANEYSNRFPLTVTVLPTVPVDSLIIPSRRQIVAENVITRMRQAYPAQSGQGDAMMVAVTASDMFIRGIPSWEWAFAFRQQGRFTALSSAHMDPVNYGLPPDSELLATRFRKMITKTIGLQAYGLRSNSDPTSLLYNSILGVDDLDNVSSDFCPPHCSAGSQST